MAAARYEIGIEGRLGSDLAVWFDQLEIVPDREGGTVLRGWFADPSALQGLLSHLADLGIEVVSLRRLSRTG